MAARCDARLVAAYARHARAADGDALLAAAEELAAIGALRYAMEAAADASRAYRDVRKQDGARRALVRAEELHREGALVLSRRTVESHLYHAMRKLGVSDRRELPRLDLRAWEPGRARSAPR